MIHIKSRYSIEVFYKENGQSPHIDWLKNLDVATRSRIIGRMTRLENGLFGDHKAVGSGVFEARLFFGPGYRVYFAIVGTEIVLLLMGGDKSRQSRDIDIAKEFLTLYLERANANKKQ